MKKKEWRWIIYSIVVMILFPYCILRFVPSDAAMIATILLFFLVDPLFSIMTGIAAGYRKGLNWLLPLLNVIFYCGGVWFWFDYNEPDFLTYATLYLILGYASLLVHYYCVHHKKVTA